MTTGDRVMTWVVVAILWLCTVAIVWTTVLAPDLGRGLLVGATGLIVAVTAYCLTDHVWCETARARRERLDDRTDDDPA